MNALKKTLLYSSGLLASFVLGVWFASEKSSSSVADGKLTPVAANSIAKTISPPAANATSVALIPQPKAAGAYALVALSPRAAMDEATKAPEATRLATMQNIMAIWLRTDRLAAAEWMTEKQGLREFEPLSAQVSDAFFPDDTEMSAMFCFDLSDATLRDTRVNKLVAYWKSGAHLKFDNSPWEVDGVGNGSAKTATTVSPAQTTIEPAAKTEPQS